MAQPATVPENISDCQLCGGTGWRTLPPDADHKSSRVTRCRCQTGLRADKLLARARIPARYQGCTLDNFEIEIDGKTVDSLSKARFEARGFVEHYPVERAGLLITGPIGTGKSHLAVGIINNLIQTKSIACRFYDYRDLLKQIRNAYNPSVSATELEVLRPVVDSEIVVIDDIGTEKVSDWVEETIGYILNERYNNRRTTILTTNLPNLPPTLVMGESQSASVQAKKAMNKETLGDRITERMRSRLLQMCRHMDIQADDYRERFKPPSKEQGDHREYARRLAEYKRRG